MTRTGTRRLRPVRDGETAPPANDDGGRIAYARKCWWVRCTGCKGLVIGRYLTSPGAAGLVAEHEAHRGHKATVEHHPED